MNQGTLSKLRKEARKSQMRYKHAACCVTTGGEVVAFAHNYRHPHKTSMHAEIAALNKFINNYAPRGRKLDYILVCRINPNGKFMKSDPCDKCCDTLGAIGITAIPVPPTRQNHEND